MKEKEIVSANILKVSVDTNCPKGGDAGHGGITQFILEDLASTSWQIGVVYHDGSGTTQKMHENVKRLRINLFGDTEAETFNEALEAAAMMLRETINVNKKSKGD